MDTDVQACHAAYETIDETAVYNCTGNPHPKDIERVVESMMSDEFGTSFSRTCFTPLRYLNLAARNRHPEPSRPIPRSSTCTRSVSLPSQAP